MTLTRRNPGKRRARRRPGWGGWPLPGERGAIHPERGAPRPCGPERTHTCLPGRAAALPPIRASALRMAHAAGFCGGGARASHLPAFTLIELLVVLAVLGVLAALLLPTLGKAKAGAQQVACVNHFKQLTASWKMYADDHGGRLVPVFYFFRGEINTNAWVRGSMDDDTSVYPPIEPGVLDSTNLNGIVLGSLYPYNRSVGVYHCPADKIAVGGVARVRSYALNGWMGGTWVKGQSNYVVFKREQDIVRPPPSRAWVFIDEHERSINDGWFAVDMKGDRGLLDAPATRHNAAYALSFADGHVEVWKLRDPRSIHWTALPIPNQPPNPDWQQLAAASSSLRE